MSEERPPRPFYELHTGLPREGPGNTESTLRALAMVPEMLPGTEILDIGCGSGLQTLDLARHTASRIFALDNHVAYIEELERRACPTGYLPGRGTCAAPLFPGGDST